MVITLHHFRQTQKENKPLHVNSVKDIGINHRRLWTLPSRFLHVYHVQLMFVSNVLGIRKLGDISALNVQREVSMILCFRIVERYVRLLITRFKYYLLDILINQLLPVSVHAKMVLYLTQQLISVKNVFLKIVFLVLSKMVNLSVINVVLVILSTLMVNVLTSVNLATVMSKEFVKNATLVKSHLQVINASLVLKSILSVLNVRQWIQMEYFQKSASLVQMDWL